MIPEPTSKKRKTEGQRYRSPISNEELQDIDLNQYLEMEQFDPLLCKDFLQYNAESGEAQETTLDCSFSITNPALALRNRHAARLLEELYV